MPYQSIEKPTPARIGLPSSCERPRAAMTASNASGLGLLSPLSYDFTAEGDRPERRATSGRESRRRLRCPPNPIRQSNVSLKSFIAAKSNVDGQKLWPDRPQIVTDFALPGYAASRDNRATTP